MNLYISDSKVNTLSYFGLSSDDFIKLYLAVIRCSFLRTLYIFWTVKFFFVVLPILYCHLNTAFLTLCYQTQNYTIGRGARSSGKWGWMKRLFLSVWSNFGIWMKVEPHNLEYWEKLMQKGFINVERRDLSQLLYIDL